MFGLRLLNSSKTGLKSASSWVPPGTMKVTVTGFFDAAGADVGAVPLAAPGADVGAACAQALRRDAAPSIAVPTTNRRRLKRRPVYLPSTVHLHWSPACRPGAGWVRRRCGPPEPGAHPTSGRGRVIHPD